MGVWGVGLYSGDFARDWRAAAAAMGRLPYGGDRLLEILREAKADAANNPRDEDHSTFWRIVAAPFARRGIAGQEVDSKAVRIVDSGIDISTLTALGMEPVALRKRQESLAELRPRLTARPAATRRGPILKKPQSLLMEMGDVFADPTSHGECINRYFRSKADLLGGKQDSWSAAILVDRGRVFDCLTWYRPLS